jgi:ABC-type nitrate/sulfonate/bicarbonate transport system substrate-binding protein
MRYKILFSGLLFCIEFLAFVSLSCAASGSQKLKITYASLTGAYAPFWIAVEESLGRKYGLDLEAIYPGRTNANLILASGEAQYSVSAGFGVVRNYALGEKDPIIIASFTNTTGYSIYSKPQITKSANLRGKVIGSGRPGAVSDTLLRYVLKNRLSLDPTRDVKIVPLGEPPNILPALEKGVVDAAILATPARWMARKMGFRELLDFDELGIQVPYTGVTTLKATVKKSPDTTVKLVATLTDAIQVFKTNKEKSLLVMKKYLRGTSDEILGETYGYFSSRTQKFPYPSFEAIKTALDMLSDQYPQAKNVDPHEVADLSFVKQVESGGVR